MTLLTQKDIADRIALYQRYATALQKLTELEAAFPFEPPADLHVSWAGSSAASVGSRAEFVIRRAWSALRGAALADARTEIEAAEAAVTAFENGEEIDDTNRSDGPVGGAVAGEDAG